VGASTWIHQKALSYLWVCLMSAIATMMSVAVSLMLILIILASSVIYFVERDAQPLAFQSIPAAMWWSVSTMTTVGYGDIFPVTWLGKIFGSIVALLGIGLFALPAAFLGSGFVEEIGNPKKVEIKTCPHCGKNLDGSFGK
jgi:voltage-gated potassium channel